MLIAMLTLEHHSSGLNFHSTSIDSVLTSDRTNIEEVVPKLKSRIKNLLVPPGVSFYRALFSNRRKTLLVRLGVTQPRNVP